MQRADTLRRLALACVERIARAGVNAIQLILLLCYAHIELMSIIVSLYFSPLPSIMNYSTRLQGVCLNLSTNTRCQLTSGRFIDVWQIGSFVRFQMYDRFTLDGRRTYQVWSGSVVCSAERQFYDFSGAPSHVRSSPHGPHELRKAPAANGRD